MSLFGDVPVARKWAGSRELAVVDGCPDCGTELVEQSSDQPALFIHGGHGADRTTIWRVCPNGDCRWSIEAVVVETKPLVRPPRIGGPT